MLPNFFKKNFTIFSDFLQNIEDIFNRSKTLYIYQAVNKSNFHFLTHTLLDIQLQQRNISKTNRVVQMDINTFIRHTKINYTVIARKARLMCHDNIDNDLFCQTEAVHSKQE